MKTRLSPLISFLILAAIILTPSWASGAEAKEKAPPQTDTPWLTPGTTRVSVASDGSQGNYDSLNPSISADGRYVAFESRASNLVNGDTNKVRDIFVHDRQTGTTIRVSVASNRAQGDRDSEDPCISALGRYVAFRSIATNLVSEDTNGVVDIFVHDRQTGSTERVSVASDGSQGNDSSFGSKPSFSVDGRYVTFLSSASNLVNRDTNGTDDVFVHDLQTGITERVSVASDGSQGKGGSGGASISADGRYVAFDSEASNLVSGDSNAAVDIFVHDRQTGNTERVSVASDGSQANGYSASPSISANGIIVAFTSAASNLVSGDTSEYMDIFVHDRLTGKTELVSLAIGGSQGNGHSYTQSLSAEGRFVAFYSDASNLVIGDTNGYGDIFVHDRYTGITRRVSVAGDGSQANSNSYIPSISLDGRYVLFESYASNLVSGDTNGTWDVFVHDRGEGPYGYAIYLPFSQNRP
ncbi:MAG TPA: hypothetical protein VI776_04650 [Anaerolineales bacterium]|jgi:hypothetical protein|nr:hypothetical protein [Anaerolineales bacterium]